MHLLESANIEGFWNNKRILVDFRDDVNCIIGINGSGKTTLINLLAACMSGDVQLLFAVPFRKIELRFKAARGRTRPGVTVEKDVSKGHANLRIEFKEKAKSRPFRASAVDVSGAYYSRSLFDHPNYMPEIEEYRARMQKLCSFRWLPVHRSEVEQEGFPSEQLSPIDKKIEELTSEISSYFFQLRGRAARATTAFQETFFMSSLYDSDSDLWPEKYDLSKLVSQIDPEAEAHQLENVFQRLGIPPRKVKHRIKEHYEKFKSGRATIQKNEGISIPELNVVLNSIKLHTLVPEWHKLEEKIGEINRARKLFEETVNTYYQRKDFSFDERNRGYAATQSGKRLPISRLSSGEKQLFIFLAEAMITDESPAIIIADEPELSLHLEWQEMLLGLMRELNPEMQVIVATHSPDIVGPHQQAIIDMEDIISDL